MAGWNTRTSSASIAVVETTFTFAVLCFPFACASLIYLLVSLRLFPNYFLRLLDLPDVKRWLSEFRGKDMADSFAWSYKR